MKSTLAHFLEPIKDYYSNKQSVYVNFYTIYPDDNSPFSSISRVVFLKTPLTIVANLEVSKITCIINITINQIFLKVSSYYNTNITLIIIQILHQYLKFKLTYSTSEAHGLIVIPVDWILWPFLLSNCHMFFLYKKYFQLSWNKEI